jgi:FkbM family methyltransferase
MLSRTKQKGRQFISTMSSLPVEFLKKVLPRPIKRRIRELQVRLTCFSISVADPLSYESFAQEGEDMVLRSILRNQGKGFYVDVGAYHPRRYSNTQYYYCLGWHGINIEADAHLIQEFVKERPRDVNIHCGVGGKEEVRRLTTYIEPALNTFNLELVSKRKRDGVLHEVVSYQEVPMRTLASILEENLPVGQAIDFMTVDVEGLDLEVLESNNWRRYRPRYVLVECFGVSLSEINDDQTVRFLEANSYQLIAKTLNTCIFATTEVVE